MVCHTKLNHYAQGWTVQSLLRKKYSFVYTARLPQAHPNQTSIANA